MNIYEQAILMLKPINLHYLKGVILLAVAGILWSMGGALIKWVSLDAYQVSFWRSLFAFITLVWITRPRKISWEWLNLAAAFSYALTLLFFVIGTKMTTAANAIFLQYTAPLYIVGLSFFLFKEKFLREELITMIFCIIGITLFFSDQVDFTDYIGMLWSLASGIAYAAFIVFSKKRNSGHYSEPVMLSAFFCMIISGFIMLGNGIKEDSLGTHFMFNWEDGLILAFLGIFQIGIPCYLYMKGLHAVTSLEAGLITMVEPICNPIWAFLLISEIPSTNTLLGGGVIIIAVLIHTWITYIQSQRRKNKIKF